MTSSLVGSEMCIRDRTYTILPGLLVHGENHGEGNRLAYAMQLVPVLFCPVSYTHLTLPTICSV
eukprot:9831079-Prorocentrum_lima.AAC.1